VRNGKASLDPGLLPRQGVLLVRLRKR
jgi:hypothetical protein